MMQNKKPVYLLAGRSSVRRANDPLIQAVYRESGTLTPAVAYVGVANEDSKDFFTRMADYFKENGASRVDHAVITPPRADIKKAKAVLESADIIFVSGGDVERGMEIVEEKRMTDFLKALYGQGKMFFGISAGSIMLAKEWVRWLNPDDDSSAELFPCLGFASVICDTHDEQANFEELQAAIALEKDGTKGYGIASGAAIKVYPEGKVEALGSGVYQYVRQGNKIIRVPDLLPVP